MPYFCKKIKQLTGNQILSFIAMLLLCSSAMNYTGNVTADHFSKAALNNSSSSQLSEYISGRSALLNILPPSVPPVTITILQNVSFGSGYKNKLLASGGLDDPLLSPRNMRESITTQYGLPFSEILLALCVWRI